MDDLDMHARRSTEVDGFIDRRQNAVRLIAQMCEIGGVVTLQDAARCAVCVAATRA